MRYRIRHAEIDAVELAVIADDKPTDERHFVLTLQGGARAMVDSETFRALYEPAGAVDASPVKHAATKKTRAVIKREAVDQKIRKPRVATEPSTRTPATGFSMSIKDAIRQAVRESPRTTAEVCDRVEAIRPGTMRTSIYPDITALVQRNEIGKGGDMKYHVTGLAGRATA